MPPNLHHSDHPNHEGFYLDEDEQEETVETLVECPDGDNISLGAVEEQAVNSSLVPSTHNDHNHVRRYIKQLSDLVADPLELDSDVSRLSRTLAEVSEGAFGVSGIALWVLDEDSGRLVQPPGGWWLSPLLRQTDALAQLEESESLPTSVPPGVDVAGVLWLEDKHSSGMRSSLPSMENMISWPHPSHPESLHLSHQSSALIWRDLQSLLEDPFSAKSDRLALLVQSGFQRAAGITFHHAHHRGIVIYFTERSRDHDDKLCSLANTVYLERSTQCIASVLALIEARRASVAAKHELTSKLTRMDSCDCRECSERLKEKLEVLDEEEDAPSPPKCTRCMHSLQHRSNAWFKKLRGGGLQIPPSLSSRQAIWTIIGVFCGMLVVSSLDTLYKDMSGSDYFLLMGPFGALMTLQYGLVSAPASQPRNAILGQAVAGAVSLSLTYIPEYILPAWLRYAVGPALAIGAMVKLGITHPPAGAHAVMYSSGDYGFVFYALVVLTTAVAVLPAITVNNLSNKRQYPTYW